jgi:hypothetical protein
MNIFGGSFESNALLGTADPGKFTDIYRLDVEKPILTEKVHAPSLHPKSTISYTITVIAISALIFVTILSIFDVIKNAINYAYSIQHRSELSSQILDLVVSSGYFSLTCVGISILVIPILAKVVHKHLKIIHENKG